MPSKLTWTGGGAAVPGEAPARRSGGCLAGSRLGRRSGWARRHWRDRRRRLQWRRSGLAGPIGWCALQPLALLLVSAARFQALFHVFDDFDGLSRAPLRHRIAGRQILQIVLSQLGRYGLPDDGAADFRRLGLLGLCQSRRGRAGRQCGRNRQRGLEGRIGLHAGKEFPGSSRPPRQTEQPPSRGPSRLARSTGPYRDRRPLQVVDDVAGSPGRQCVATRRRSKAFKSSARTCGATGPPMAGPPFRGGALCVFRDNMGRSLEKTRPRQRPGLHAWLKNTLGDLIVQGATPIRRLH